MSIGLHDGDLRIGDEIVVVWRAGSGHRLVNERVLASVLAAGVDLLRIFVGHGATARVAS
jgi:hypothetical protein